MPAGADIGAARIRLAAAGEALRERDPARTLDSLAGLLDAWREPGSRFQERIAAALPATSGFSPETVRDGLTRALAAWSGDALRALVAGGQLSGLPPGSRATGFDRTHVLLAGALPMPTLLSLAAPLLLHSPVLAKTASRDPVTAHLFRESLQEVDPQLAAALEIVSFRGSDPALGSDEARSRDFADAPCLVATGSDETVARMRGLARAGARVVGYGHRLSVAVVGADALASQEARADTAEALSRDVAAWDQQGCLSPVAVFALGAAPARIDALAGSLAEALARRERETPRGAIEPEAAALARAERDAALMRHGAGEDVRVEGDPALRFTVIREADARLRPAPLNRFVRIHPVPDRAGLRAALEPLSRHLAGVALAGLADERARVADDLVALGASRVCRAGRLQTPPLGWHHDNQPLLLPLARITDLETGAGG